jgi:Kef-type K+ transport system membrane component KefB
VTPLQLSILFFLQLAVILAACRLVGMLARRFGQPQVVGEMMTGVLLGPSLFGLWLPEWQAWLFPTESRRVIYVVSQVGLSLYMFLVGLEFKSELFRSRAASAAAVSVAGMAAPFTLGAALAVLFIQSPVFFTPDVKPWEAMVFLGASMSITAFPMLARIIVERGLSGTALGTLALAAGAIDDAAAWCLLAVVLASFEDNPMIAATAIGGGVLYTLITLTVGRRIFRLLAKPIDRTGDVPTEVVSATLMLVMLGSWLTDAIGIYAVFGAFIMGCAMPRGVFAEQMTAKLQPLVVTLLLPLFFIYSGLNTRLDLVTTPMLWAAAVLVLLAACLGKGVACWWAARRTGTDNISAMAIGSLMNARGLMELIILNIGLERGLITPQLFSIMVIMAIVTTLMATPLFEWVTRSLPRSETGQLQSHASL